MRVEKMEQRDAASPSEYLVVGVFRNREVAQAAVERLIEKDVPLDRVSILGQAGSGGDDILGISYSGVGGRMRAWGVHGAFWGGLWGLLAGAAGFFVIPGLGAIAAAGPIVEAITGAIAGAALTGGTMAGAAALSQLAVAIHRIGVPEEKLSHFHEAIEQGHYLVILRCHEPEAERWRRELAWAHADETDHFPVHTLRHPGV
jgi:hypothetical protein